MAYLAGAAIDVDVVEPFIANLAAISTIGKSEVTERVKRRAEPRQAAPAVGARPTTLPWSMPWPGCRPQPDRPRGSGPDPRTQRRPALLGPGGLGSARPQAGHIPGMSTLALLLVVMCVVTVVAFAGALPGVDLEGPETIR